MTMLLCVPIPDKDVNLPEGMVLCPMLVTL